jgi:hypothetical protein
MEKINLYPPFIKSQLRFNLKNKIYNPIFSTFHLAFIFFFQTRRMREQIVGFIFYGLNVEFRSNFEFELKMKMKLVLDFIFLFKLRPYENLEIGRNKPLSFLKYKCDIIR